MALLSKDEAAIVLFQSSSHPWLRFLKKGFQHCCVVIKADDHTVLIDPTSRDFVVRVSDVGLQDILYLAGKNDVKAVPTRRYKQTTRNKVPSFFNCVAVCKKVLGIRAFWIVTPHQLYRHLTK